ncbi:glycine oxidase ThiO [uncultured Maritalea sp.]|jgi:glycine oxidase|uniref:glycine oxidase ThiO n=1 Tax=uncultured Maritalea sp. TaxID=757249 RepID=UPI002621B720|nr:glycine oxidase ThiO [uncultured Maritalea sp.]
MRVTILGAGVAGLTAATELVARGVDVEIVERGAAPGAQSCSWYAGGMLAPECEADMAEPIVVELGREALAWWQKYVPDIVQRGSIVVSTSRDRNELKRFGARTKCHQWLKQKELAALEPDLGERFAEALFFKDEAHMDPRAALLALTQHLCEQGVKFHYGATLEDVTPGGKIIDARGLAARDFLPQLRGVRGEMLVVKCDDVQLSRPVRLAHPRFPVYIVPRGEGLYMIGATQIESERAGGVSAKSMVDLINAAYAVHPAFGEAEIVETGAQLRPAFPDNLPRVNWVNDRLHINGLFRHGYLLSPACARMAADILCRSNQPAEFMDEDHNQWATA